MRKITFQKSRIIRWTVLSASTIFFLCFSGIFSVHAVCPIGGFEIFFSQVFRTGFTWAGLFSAMVVTFLIMSLFSIFFRRAYCAYICPLGALQELSMLIGRKLLPQKIRKLRLHPVLDSILRYVKYFVLASFLVGAFLGAGHWMIPGDPFIVLIDLFGGGSIADTMVNHLSAFVFLIIIIVYAFFMGKGFCKYLCPAGAWYGLLSKLSPNRIKRNESSCVDCGLCSNACVMDLDVAHMKDVKSAECIGCMECVNACPKDDVLSSSFVKNDLKPVLVPVSAAVLFTGSLFLAASLDSHGGEDRKGEHGPQIEKQQEHESSDSVSYSGGCPDCVGCGLCRTA